MSLKLQIETLTYRKDIVEELADLLIEVVANGGSVSFMHPLSKKTAMTFWKASLESADRGERIVLGARENGKLISTVTLLLNCPENQPHRAEIAKLMTSIVKRGNGVARALVTEAEQIAVKKGRTLLNLDTAADEGAAGFYESLGFHKTGVIPDYALKPHGGLTDTIIYWKKIGNNY
ncbi:MAG TPA: GNAT family N-acetyltransferase [Puia sp.]|jgi:ribosomal protein S18 acetylase RimI-like enzyme|nr:GNAT family N-acetyltransferase [Puia sp.]